VKVTVRQRDVVCAGEGLITVTHELMGQLGSATVSSQGLPGYTAESIYRAAVASGIMERVAYQDTIAEAG
jgi:hypothetical protein